MSRDRVLRRSLSTLFRIGAIAVLATGFGLGAQAADPLDRVARDGAGREALEALARQPEEVREAALQVSARPDLFVRVEGIRSWTRRAFEQILEDQPEKERADLWELVRYPELVDAMVEPGERGDLDDVVADHPPEVRRAALGAARNSWAAVGRMHALQRETDAALDEILVGLDPGLAAALERLIEEPAVLSVLAENLHLTVALGEAYEREPEAVRSELASLAAKVAQADQAERSEWARSLEEDPELRSKVDEASEAWEDDYGRSYDLEPRTVAQVVRSYPYWYGYPHSAADFYVPSAHAHTLWYPRSYRAHCGYYYGHGQTLVVFAAPSFPFLHWLRDRHPDHHYYSSHHRWQRARHISHWDGHRQRRHARPDRHYRQYRSEHGRSGHGRHHRLHPERRRDGRRAFDRRHGERRHRDIRVRDDRVRRDRIRDRDSDRSAVREARTTADAENRRHAREVRRHDKRERARASTERKREKKAKRLRKRERRERRERRESREVRRAPQQPQPQRQAQPVPRRSDRALARILTPNAGRRSQKAHPAAKPRPSARRRHGEAHHVSPRLARAKTPRAQTAPRAKRKGRDASRSGKRRGERRKKKR